DANDLFETAKNFIEGLGLPTTLADIDIALDDGEQRSIAADTLRMVLIKNNPRTATETDCVELLEQMA
ncbi:MAG: hypothetical protein MUO62_08820, partial [Anaerolineales bacterium]|nr:hypothetical protein [Anaerolineales bacterium]